MSKPPNDARVVRNKGNIPVLYNLSNKIEAATAAEARREKIMRAAGVMLHGFCGQTKLPPFGPSLDAWIEKAESHVASNGTREHKSINDFDA